MFLSRLSALSAAAGAVLIAAPALAEEDPEDAAPCHEAVALSLLGPTIRSADAYLACAKVPGQTAYKIAHSRYERFAQLAAMDKRDLAEAELIALSTPPLSRAPVFTNAPSGAIVIGGEQSIGHTQVEILGLRAKFRFVAQDYPAALDLANRSIAMAGYDPGVLLDTEAAFALRSRLALAAKNNEQGIKLAVRAYLRGSDDPLIQEVIGQQGATIKDQLATMRAQLRDKLASYPFAISARGRVSNKPEDVERVVSEAKAAAAQLEAFEREQLGPL